MFTGIKIAAISAAKGVGGAVVFGIGFTLGASITRAALTAVSGAANRLADKSQSPKTARNTMQAPETAVQAS